MCKVHIDLFLNPFVNDRSKILFSNSTDLKFEQKISVFTSIIKFLVNFNLSWRDNEEVGFVLIFIAQLEWKTGAWHNGVAEVASYKNRQRARSVDLGCEFIGPGGARI
jgi:hypothetical protein